MDIVEAIRQRQSIRGFKPDPIPRETLREILEIALCAPSGVNAQPWEIAVLTGEVLDRIKEDNVKRYLSGVPAHPEVTYKRLEGVYRQRQVNVAIQLFQLLGIAREDKEERARWQQKGLRFFDAPAAFILYTESSLEEARTQFDIGVISQTICLAALSYGLGTCIKRQGVEYPEVVREFTGIPESKRITIAIAVGYPDRDDPINSFHSEREPLDVVSRWHGFDKKIV